MALLGDQRKIDVNKDGEITAKDFEMLREQRQSGGLLDDDMNRLALAEGNKDDGNLRAMLMQQKAMQMMQKSPLDDVAYDQMIMDMEENPNISGFRKPHSGFDMFIQDQESKDMFLNLLKNRDEILEREQKAEGGEMRMPSEDYLSYLIELDKKELKNVYQEVMKDRTDRLSDRLDNQTLGQILGGGINLSERIISGLGGSGFDKIPVFKGTSEEKAFIEAAKKELNKREQKAEGGDVDSQMAMLMEPQQEQDMVPDEEMEEDYLDFILDEALSEEEEDMLQTKLEQDEQLALLFDKVIDVAQEFAGAGLVEGPGNGTSDSIPARLSDGEFVFTAKAVEQIGADNLMQMMKDAEAAYDAGGERKAMQDGGEMQIDEDDKKVEVEYSVTRPMAGEQSLLGQVQEEDETSMEIKKSMMSPFGHVRS